MNAAGCDSIVTLDLTIDPMPDVSVTENPTFLAADQQGAVYQWLDCDDNNNVIGGATDQFYSPTATYGNYAVEVDFGGCVDTSGCFVLDFTSLTDLEKEMISIHPNPASKVLTISKAEGLGNVIEMEVLSPTGEVVMEAMNFKNELDVSALASGVYLLHLVHDYGVTSIRFVKQ